MQGKLKYEGSIFVAELPLEVSLAESLFLDKALRVIHRFQNELIIKLRNQNQLLRESKLFKRWKANKNALRHLEERPSTKAIKSKIKTLAEENKAIMKELEIKFSLYSPENSKKETAYRLNDKLSITNFGAIILRKQKPFADHLISSLGTAISKKVAHQWLTNKFENGAKTKLKKLKQVRTIPDNGADGVLTFDPKTQTVTLKWLKAGESTKHVFRLSFLDEKLTHAISLPIQSKTLVKKRINGQSRWFLQIGCMGTPLLNFTPATSGLVGVDLGTQHTAVAYDEGVLSVSPLNDSGFRALIRTLEKAQEKLQRKLSRMDTVNNPDAFDEKGTPKRGHRLKHSRRWWRLRRELDDLQRKMADLRSITNSAFANEILSKASKIHVESCSIKGWQKLFGSSVNNYAPGSIVQKLKYKVSYTGQEIMEINTKETALSQHCVCGFDFRTDENYHNSLENRLKHCPKCDRKFDRDKLAAYLARYVEQKEVVVGKEIKIVNETNYRAAQADLKNPAASGLVTQST